MASEGRYTITTNYDGAGNIAQRAVDMLRRRIHPFDSPCPFPDAIVPEEFSPGSLEHARFLFYACNFDSGIKAEAAYAAARQMVKTTDLADLHRLSKPDLIKLLLPSLKGISRDPGAARVDLTEVIYTNSRKLYAEFGNDPRGIYVPGENHVWDTLKGIMNGKKGTAEKFSQYGHGKAALLLKNFTRFGIWPFEHHEIPIKVDRHLLRISVGSNVIQVIDSRPPADGRIRIDVAERPLMRLYHRITSQEGISAVDLNDAFWLIGSRVCTENDYVTCCTSCRIHCETRPKFNERLTWYYPNTDMRKNRNHQILPMFWMP